MRAILLLYLTVAAIKENRRPRADRRRRPAAPSTRLYISGGTYLFSIPLGGYIADRIIGQRNAHLWFGGMLHHALGNCAARFPGQPANLLLRPHGHRRRRGPAEARTCRARSSAQLYPEGQPGSRRDAGFSIFYMGINLGAAIGLVPRAGNCSAELRLGNWRFALRRLRHRDAARHSVLHVLPALSRANTRPAAAGHHVGGAVAHQWARELDAHRASAWRWRYSVLLVAGRPSAVDGSDSRCGWRSSNSMSWRHLCSSRCSTSPIWASVERAWTSRRAQANRRHRRCSFCSCACAMFWARLRTGRRLDIQHCLRSSTRHTDRSRHMVRRLDNMSAPGTLQTVEPDLHHHLRAGVRLRSGCQLGARNLDPSAPREVRRSASSSWASASYIMVLGRRSSWSRPVSKVVDRPGCVLTYLFHTFGELCLSPGWTLELVHASSRRQKLRRPGMLGVWFLGDRASATTIAGLRSPVTSTEDDGRARCPRSVHEDDVHLRGAPAYSSVAACCSP